MRLRFRYRSLQFHFLSCSYSRTFKEYVNELDSLTEHYNITLRWVKSLAKKPAGVPLMWMEPTCLPNEKGEIENLLSIKYTSHLLRASALKQSSMSLNETSSVREDSIRLVRDQLRWAVGLFRERCLPMRLFTGVWVKEYPYCRKYVKRVETPFQILCECPDVLQSPTLGLYVYSQRL